MRQQTDMYYLINNDNVSNKHRRLLSHKGNLIKKDVLKMLETEKLSFWWGGGQGLDQSRHLSEQTGTPGVVNLYVLPCRMSVPLCLLRGFQLEASL